MLFPDRIQVNEQRRHFLKLFAGLGFSSLCPCLTGCAGNAPLSIASHVWPGYEFLFLAQNLGLFDTRQIHLIETKSASDSMKALQDQQVHGATLTLDEVLRARDKGLPLRIILLMDISAGADVLISRPEINSLADLKGKRLGVEDSALGELMLNKILKKAQLQRRDVDMVQINYKNHQESWQQNRLDAIITYEPTASLLEAQGMKRIFDSREIPNTIFDVLAIRSDALLLYKENLKSLVKAHFKAQWLWRSNPFDTSFRVAKHLGVSAQKISLLFQGLELPDLIYNRHALTKTNYQLLASAKEVAQILGFHGDEIGPELFCADFLAESEL